MEIAKELVEQIGLNEDQIKGISSYFSDEIAKIKGEYDGKANSDAEGILDGAVKRANELTGLNLQREKGEKWGDFLGKFTQTALDKEKNELLKKQSEYEDKLKNFKGSDDLKSKLEKAQADNDALLQKYADYDDIKSKAEQFEPLSNELSSFKKEVAFSKVMPSFPKEANKYEVDAKWNAFKKDVLDKYNIEIVDGEAVGVSKENKHLVKKLSELVDSDESLKSLLVGRQQGGLGSKDVNMTDIEGVPFKVPEAATPAERTKLIREHLASKGIKNTSPEYANEFNKLNKAILTKK